MGFLPTLPTSGTRDHYLSNTVAMHQALRKAEIGADPHICGAMPDGGFGGTAPNDEEVRQAAAAFLRWCLL